MPARGRGEEKFYKVKQFPGYVNQPDITNIAEGYLVRGSQNVVIKDTNRIGIRKGYEVYGAENSALDAIEATNVFTAFGGNERLVRAYDDTLEYEYSGTFYELMSSLTTVDFTFARNDFWNVGELFSEQLFVDGSSNIYSWNGAITTFASATSNTLTKEGTATWAEAGFRKNNIGVLRVTITSNALTGQALSFDVGSTTYTYTEGVEWAAGADINASATALADAINDESSGVISYAELDEIVISVGSSGDTFTSFTGDVAIDVPTLPAKQVIISGTTYTYTGGESTTALTGVTPNPSSAGHAVGTPIAQSVVTYANDSDKGLPAALNNNLIEVWHNHVIVGSTDGQVIHYSAIDEIENYKIRNPRRAGDGNRFTMGSTLVGFAVQKDLFVFTKSDIYVIKQSLSDDFTKDYFSVEKGKTSPGEGAKSQRLILPIKNGIMYVSNEPAVNFFGSIKDFEDFQVQNISDLIKIDMEGFSFTNATMHYHNRDVYFALPDEGFTLIYDMKDGYWQPPQTLPMRSYQTLNNVLYGFSAYQTETYTMFTGKRDRGLATDVDVGFAIPANASFSYMQFGDREQFKYFNEAYIEGYMSVNTTLTFKILYELYGCAGTSFVDFNQASNGNIFCYALNDGPLGKTSLGKHGLGNGIGASDDIELPKIRAILQFGNTARQFREIGPVIETSEIDAEWDILTFGFAESNSQAQGVDIKVS